ncbi:MAG: bifunctional DNA-formamidopyrimidine glycosylase/DNA-(apurinic or apyrimidinic site) lyase [Actinomycetota bacterium]
MPELPEIEVMRRDLEKEIVGRRIKDVEVRPGTNAMKIIKRHGRRKELQDLLTGAKVDRIERVGRRLLLHFDNGNVALISLGPSGQLKKVSASEAVEAHTHIVFSFTIGGQLRLTDPARKADVFVTSAEHVEEMPELRDFMIDPLESPVTWNDFSILLSQREATLREVLTDDHFVVGLGDIYTDEVLWASGLRHDKMSNKLSSQDVRRLYRGLMETLQEAVKAQGMSIGAGDFSDLQGNPGQFQLELKVYDRAGEACRRCRSTIVKQKAGGRFTYFCAQCQS